jgi:hypothetical protein
LLLRARDLKTPSKFATNLISLENIE